MQEYQENDGETKSVQTSLVSNTELWKVSLIGNDSDSSLTGDTTLAWIVPMWEQSNSEPPPGESKVASWLSGLDRDQE